MNFVLEVVVTDRFHCIMKKMGNQGIGTNWFGNPHPLRWRHNGNDGVSNHQPPICLLNRLFGLRSKETSKLRVTGLCAGNSPETVVTSKHSKVWIVCISMGKYCVNPQPWSKWLVTLVYTVKPVYNDYLMGYFSAFWSSSRWPRAT